MTAPLWNADELNAALGPASAPLSRAVGGVSIDTRTLQPGDLFFAIRGEANDGHAFVAKAFERGAAAAVVETGRAQELGVLGPVFPADDTLRAMERLGSAARARCSAGIVAVTGSVGKTSAKEMLRTVLSPQAPTHASVASYNNHWGVPLTLARMPRQTGFGVFELGMNHAGEISALTRQVRPHVALVTTIAPVHIEYLGSLRAIADAKAEIFEGLEPDGVAVLNRDAPEIERLRAKAVEHGARILTFGRSPDADAQLVGVETLERGLRIHASFGGRAQVFLLGAPGEHMAMNALGVLLAAEAVGADRALAAEALAAFASPKGRGERVTLARDGVPFTLIDESYNANPASMRAALRLLGETKPTPGGRRIAVLGDMLELGEDARALHADLAPVLEVSRVDLLIGAGPLTRALVDAAPSLTRTVWGDTARDIEATALEEVRGGDVVMVKGSNGSRMGPIVAALRERYAPKAD